MAITDRTNLVTIVALLRLADQGIGEADLELVPAGSMSNALLALKRGRNRRRHRRPLRLRPDAGGAAPGLRLAYLSEALPGVTLLARPGLPASEREAIRQALLRWEIRRRGRIPGQSRLPGRAPGRRGLHAPGRPLPGRNPAATRPMTNPFAGSIRWKLIVATLAVELAIGRRPGRSGTACGSWKPTWPARPICACRK